MDEETRAIAVSPRHTVLLASELFTLIEKPPRTDFVVRTQVRREANGLPLMTAELVIASEATRKTFAAADTYPLHFCKTYFPGRLHGDPRIELEHHQRASELVPLPPPIGSTHSVFRSCLIPGQPYTRLSPFGGEPPENNIAKAQKLALSSAAGLWRLAEELLAQLTLLHAGGLSHGDTELHNCIVCPSPLEPLLVDYEAGALQTTMDAAAWEARCQRDLEPLLREATYLQCALGRQPSDLGALSWRRMPQLFKSSDRFKRAIETQAEV